MGEGFRDLIVWQRLTTSLWGVYKATRGFPKTEIYGITNQIQRAAISIPANIAEGYGRGSIEKNIFSFS